LNKPQDSSKPLDPVVRSSEFQMELDVLDRVIENRPRGYEIPADELFVARPVQRIRIAWNFNTDGTTLDLEPWEQLEKSKGWGNGRSLANYMNWPKFIEKSIVDDQLCNRWFAREYDGFDPLSVAEKLIGQSNVLLDGEPVDVLPIDGVFELHVREDRVSIRPSGWDFQQKLFLSDTIGIITTPKQSIGLFRVTKEQSAILKGFDWMRELPRKEFEGELLRRAKMLQSIVSLQLPEEIGGSVQLEDSQLVLLLKSNTLGQLDYGFRFRNRDGKLLHPGAAPLLRAEIVDGKPIQWRRSAQSEWRQVHEAVEQLQLSSGVMSGTIDSLLDSIALVEKVQSTNGKIECLWAKGSEPPIRLIGKAQTKNVQVEVGKKRDWFQLQGKCEIGNESIEIRDLIASLSGVSFDYEDGKFVNVAGAGWVHLSEQLRTTLLRLRDAMMMEGKAQFDMASAPALRDLQEEVEFKQTKAWTECLQRLEKAEKFHPQVPPTLQASLRDYQEEGFRWMRRLAEWGVGGVLADDMGLGKTVQTIAVLLDRAELGPGLVIAPTSVSLNWMREVRKFAPQLQAQLYRDSGRDSMLENLGKNDLIVCSYGLAWRDEEKLKEIDWASMVLDEAQAIKNSRSKTSQAIASFESQWSIALTGTPVENHLGELWSLFSVVAPSVFGTWQQFRQNYAGPIESENNEERRLSLRGRIKPFILRRTKQEVLKELPPRTEMNRYVELSDAERAIYERVRGSVIGEVDKVAKIRDDLELRFKLLALITRLRQVACHVGLVHDSWEGTSAKLEELRECLLALREEGHRVLIFSQFTSHLKLMRAMMEEESITYQYLDGSTPAISRQAEVDRFQTGDATAFLISLKAGGTGLNLTAADYVIHMDPWWNPAVENQATDRAHRIGQTKPVMVYRIIAKDTIEEEILMLHESKKNLVESVLSGTESSGKLSVDDLIGLIRGNPN